MPFEAHYSIRDLEKLSGIKAHTLRIWEQRYGLLQPRRTDTNIRYYSNDDLKRILNISLLNKKGLKISVIAAMNDGELAEKVNALNLVRTQNDDLIDNLIIGMIDLNEKYFEKVFSACVLRMGFEETVQNVVFPFLSRIGTMWQTGNINPAQEHFVSNIVRQKMIVAIDGLKTEHDGALGTAVLFLPEDELHELGLLFYDYALRSRGFNTVYLGQTVPITTLERIAEIAKPAFIITVITTPRSAKEMSSLIGVLARIPEIKGVLLSGNAVLNYKKPLPSRFSTFQDLPELLSLIKN